MFHDKSREGNNISRYRANITCIVGAVLLYGNYFLYLVISVCWFGNNRMKEKSRSHVAFYAKLTDVNANECTHDTRIT